MDFHEDTCEWHFKKSGYYRELWGVMESYGDMDQALRITTPSFIAFSSESSRARGHGLVLVILNLFIIAETRPFFNPSAANCQT